MERWVPKLAPRTHIGLGGTMKIGDLVRLDPERHGLEPHEPENNIIGTIVGHDEYFPDEFDVLWSDGVVGWHIRQALILVEP